MSTAYKHLVLLGDGMSDRPLAELGGRTPLEAAAVPNLDRLAREGVLGTARTIPEGCSPGSDVANLSVLGYDPVTTEFARYDEYAPRTKLVDFLLNFDPSEGVAVSSASRHISMSW